MRMSQVYDEEEQVGVRGGVKNEQEAKKGTVYFESQNRWQG